MESNYIVFSRTRILLVALTISVVTLMSCDRFSNKDIDLGILSPEPDDMFEIGSDMTIMWEIDTFKSNELKVELCQDSVVILIISPSTPNSGSFMWSIPEDAPWGSYFNIRISDNSTDGIEVFSEGNFILFKVVDFPDYMLESQIKNALHHRQEEITTFDLSRLDVFEGEHFSNLSGIEYCSNILVLRMNLSSFTDISPLSHLEKLITLRINKNIVNIEDVSPLAALIKLTFLSLTSCGITETQFLSNMNDLIGLELSENRITDMPPNFNLKQLQYLNLQSNQIHELDWISELVNLQKLNLSKNQIIEIGPLKTLTVIEELDMSFNTIQKIDALTRLTNISVLNLSHNLIQDVQPLADNPGIGSGDTLYLGANPIHWSSSAIMELQSRGVILFFFNY